MADEIDLRQFGGVLYVRDGGDPKNPADQHWNFGIMGQPGLEGPVIADSMPALYDAAPHIQGMWDGRTTICVHDAARKVLKGHMPAQMQPRGTCGGRSAKQLLQHLQCVSIAAGKKAKYHKASHAWGYFLARKEYGMLGGGDGVPDGSIPPVLVKYGALNQEESGDTKDYGAGSDDLAVKWGSRAGAPKEMFALAADNKVAENIVRVRSFQEMADGFAAGGVGVVSSNRGFSMTRDSEGICKPKGTWSHYMTLSGIYVAKNGRAHGIIDQSWGNNTPSGPTIDDGRCPDYSFAADRDVIEQDMIKRGTVHMCFGFQLWDESAVIPWSEM